MLKRHINVCTGGDLCFSFFSNFSETPCMKVGFDIRISPVWWMRAVSRRWEIPFSFVFLNYTSTCGEQPFRTCSHDPGTAHCLGATHWPQSLASVTVHMNFSLRRGNFERWVTRCTTPGNRPCQGNFSPCEQNAKLPRGMSSLAHAHY